MKTLDMLFGYYLEGESKETLVNLVLITRFYELSPGL